MDRSNFNPDQLHEHFDRLSQHLGFELEDNARMIKFPTGHRFVLGEGNVLINTRTPRQVSTDMRLLSESGQVGFMTTTTVPEGSKIRGPHPLNTASAAAHVLFNRDRNQPSYEEGFDKFLRGEGPKPTTPDVFDLDWRNSRVDPADIHRHKITNPSSGAVDSIVDEVMMRGGDARPKTLHNAGTFTVAEDVETDRDFYTNRLGRVSMNRKSNKFEWIPD